MTAAHDLPVFLLASAVLALTPGPGVFYILARSATQGPRAGLISVAAVAIGNWLNAIAASLGLATLLALFPMTVIVLRQVGALYLIFLGVRALRAPLARVEPSARPIEAWAIFREGALLALLNPKTALFFSAFLTQFVDPLLPMAAQCIALGTIFVGIAAMSDSLYVVGAGAFVRTAARRRDRWLAVHRLGGWMLIGLGIFCALSGLNAEVDALNRQAFPGRVGG